MARRRANRGKKTSALTKFNRYARTARNVAGLAATAYKGVRFLSSIVNAEKKLFDTYGNLTDVQNAPGQFVNLNSIAAGDGVSDRTGNSIKAAYLFGNIQCNLGPTGFTGNTVRMLILQDTSGQGNLPGLSNVLEDVTDPVISPIKISEVPRYWVLKDKRWRVDTNNPVMFSKFYRKLSFHMKYNGTASNAYTKDNVFVLFITDANTSDGPDISYHFRLAFYDN